MIQNPVSEKIDYISFNPGRQDTGDLETGTTTITATSEASGVGNADYSAALTLPAPTDARLVVKRIAARLSVTIDSFDVATHLYCRVYVDAQDADHKLFDMDWDSTGAKLYADDTSESEFATIFNLLKDGAEHTFYFFFWVNQANNAVISLVQLEEGVGTHDTYGGQREIFLLDFNGAVALVLKADRSGSGSIQGGIGPTTYYYSNIVYTSSEPLVLRAENFLNKEDSFWMKSTVATDLTYLSFFYLNIRSEE